MEFLNLEQKRRWNLVFRRRVFGFGRLFTKL